MSATELRGTRFGHVSQRGEEMKFLSRPATVAAAAAFAALACSSVGDAPAPSLVAMCSVQSGVETHSFAVGQSTMTIKTERERTTIDATALGEAYVHTEMTKVGGTVHVRATFGPAFAVHSAILTSENDWVVGTIDGKNVVFAANVAPTTFLDGSPVPSLTPTGPQRVAFDKLLEVVSASPNAWASCTDDTSKVTDVAYQIAPHAHGNTGGGYDMCDDCRWGCVGKLVACLNIPFGFIFCWVFFGNCLGDCGSANGNTGVSAPCCPVPCGDGAYCCQSGEKCASAVGQNCCGPGTFDCGENCCNDGDACIFRNNGSCCPAGKQVCDGVSCCNQDDSCAFAGQEGGSVPTDECCPPKQIVCAGVCCKPGEGCLPGKSNTESPHCGVCDADVLQGSGLCADHFSCCNKTTAPGKICAKLGMSPIQCCLPKTVCDVGNTPCCKSQETCIGVPKQKDTCCADPFVCGDAEACCTDVLNPCSTSSTTPSKHVCCDTTKYQFCKVSGKCCDEFGLGTCDAVGNCVKP